MLPHTPCRVLPSLHAECCLQDYMHPQQSASNVWEVRCCLPISLLPDVQQDVPDDQATKAHVFLVGNLLLPGQYFWALPGLACIYAGQSIQVLVADAG